MRNISVLTGLIFLLLSCERDVTIELKPHTPSLVVHAYIEAGNVFEIAIGKTTSVSYISTVNGNFVENATVVLYEDGAVIDTLDFDASVSRYKSADTAYAGKTYRVVVEAPGFTTAEATSIVPALVNTTLVSYTKDARVDIDGNLLNDIVFRIIDPATPKDHYFVEIGSYFYNSFCVYTYDASVEEFQGGVDPFEVGSCISNDEILISDRIFNGTSKEITLSAASYALEDISSGPGRNPPYLKKYHITEDFYKYIKDGINIDIVEGNPFVEPHIAGGNVRNGYGLFTIYSVTTDTLR
jgi:hypothetical protein